MWGKDSYIRKQHDGRGLGVDPPTFRSEVERADHYTTALQQRKPRSQEKNYNNRVG